MHAGTRPIKLFLLIVLVATDALVWHAVAFGGPSGKLEMYFLDVGQGDSQFVTLPTGAQILIDGGPGSAVLGELSKVMAPSDRFIDLVMVSHPQLDHFSGLIEVLKRYEVGAFLWNGREGTATSWAELARVVEERKVPVIVLGAGDRVKNGSSTIAILAPTPTFLKSKELNDTSLVALLDSMGVRALFTGDIGAKVEQYLVSAYDMEVDVLKVPHHGSKYSSSAAFLKAARPEVAVVEVGRNSYGHPTAEALGRLANVGAAVYRSDKEGTVVVISDGREMKVIGL